MANNMAGDDLVLPCVQELRFAIEAEVIDAQHRGVEGVWIRLGKTSELISELRTDAEGKVRFEALVGGTYRLSLPEHDQDAWKHLDTESIAPPASGTPELVWSPPTTPPSSSASYTVQSGDCLASIAFEHGFHPDTIWKADENTKLREDRKSMHLLAPDDIVQIPERRVKTISAYTGKRFILQLPHVPEVLQVRFVTASLKPRHGVPYLLQLSLADGTPLPDRTGSTNSDGFLIEPIPPNAWSGEIWLGKGRAREVYPVQLGGLGPAEDAAGVEARLANLSYSAEDGGRGDALRQFQRDHNLEPTGQLDAATRAVLERVHLS